MSTEPDRDLAQLYRAASREEPPAWLDDAVLHASRAQHASTPSRRLPRWQAPLALAAVLTLALGLSLVVDRESGEGRDGVRALAPPAAMNAAPGASTDQSRAAGGQEAAKPALQGAAKEALSGSESRLRASSPAAALIAPSVAVPPERSEAASRADANRLPESEATPEAPPAERGEPATAARAASPSQSTGRKAAADQARAKAEGSGSGTNAAAERAAGNVAGSSRDHEGPDESRQERPASAADAAPGHAAAMPMARAIAPSPAPAQTRTPEQWLREIEQLRRAGQLERAREERDAFRKRFPDYPLPPGLE